jgi:hypothetical protein
MLFVINKCKLAKKIVQVANSLVQYRAIGLTDQILMFMISN